MGFLEREYKNRDIMVGDKIYAHMGKRSRFTLGIIVEIRDMLDNSKKIDSLERVKINSATKGGQWRYFLEIKVKEIPEGATNLGRYFCDRDVKFV